MPLYLGVVSEAGPNLGAIIGTQQILVDNLWINSLGQKLAFERRLVE